MTDSAFVAAGTEQRLPRGDHRAGAGGNPSAADRMQALADDITRVAQSMVDDGSEGESLRQMIGCVANANHLAALLTLRGLHEPG